MLIWMDGFESFLFFSVGFFVKDNKQMMQQSISRSQKENLHSIVVHSFDGIEYSNSSLCLRMIRQTIPKTELKKFNVWNDVLLKELTRIPINNKIRLIRKIGSALIFIGFISVEKSLTVPEIISNPFIVIVETE